ESRLEIASWARVVRIRVPRPARHRSLEAVGLLSRFQAVSRWPSTSRLYDRSRQASRSNTSKSVDDAREPGSARQKTAIELGVHERIPSKQLVGTLARQQHLDAAGACQRGDLGDRDRALVGQRILIVLDRRHECAPPARRTYMDCSQLEVELAGDELGPVALVAPRIVIQRCIEGDEARLHLARQGADEARV